jgi:hypothetical protein
MKRFVTACAFAISVSVFAQSPGDTLSPLRIVEKYVSPNEFPEKMRHFCCEMYQEWMAPKTLGQQLGATVQRDVHLLYQDTAKAVVTVWLHDSVTSMDVYFYLQHRNVWTVYAVRSLVMRDFAKQELKHLDSIPLEQRGKSYTEKSGHTWEFDYNNAMIWGSADTLLVSRFRSQQAEFEKLEKMREKKFPLKQTDSVYTYALRDKKIKKQADKLFIRNILIDKRAPGSILYLIGGVLDNTVGYLYQPDPTKVPQVSAGYFILIRPIGNGWYLFKTT